MGRLTLSLLGAPAVEQAGQQIRFPTRKALALLVYLCVEEGMHTREKLSTLFWPDSDAKKGRGSLRLTLSYLRDALSSGAATASNKFPLLNEQDFLGFDFASNWEMDLQRLQTAAEAARINRGALKPVERALLEDAAMRCRGEFLEGFTLADAPAFDEWASFQRELWHHRASLVFERLSQAQSESGELVDTVETAKRWVAHDPLNESAHRRLMQAYLALGNRTAALEAFATCRALLSRELNAEPSLETLALADRIPEFTEPAIDAVQGSVRPHAQIDLQSLQAPLVGRTEEHQTLVTLYRTARRGQCQVVVLEGEPGIGKTRLAGEFLRWAGAQGADVWYGRAFETGGRLSYQPLIEMLRRRLERENAPDDLLADLWLAELSQLLPELRDRYPDLPPPIIGNADFMAGRLYEAVACLAIAVAAHRPLVVLMDDVQWTDAGTRDVFHYLTRRWTEARTPVLLVLTARPESVLRDWFAGIGRDVPLTRLMLKPLSGSNLQELLHALSPAIDKAGTVGDEFGKWLLAETGGSPFFITEMLRMLQEQELLVGELQMDGRFSMDAATTWQRIQSTKHLPLSPTVRSVILARLARLTENANVLLLAAAVIGRRSSFELLCQVAHLDEFDALAALEELLDARLLVEMGDEERPLTFAHDNFRDVAYSEVGTTRRRLYHRQALGALEKVNAAAAELAFHAAAARLPDAAFRHALAAGDAAMAIHAFGDAVAHYGSALELADQVPVTLLQRCHLCVQHGRALELAGDYMAALAHYETMGHKAEQKGERELALVALIALSAIRTTATNISDFALAEALGERALALARELGDKVAEAKILWMLLNVYRMTYRNQRAQAAGEQALTLAQALGLREQMAFVANDLVYMYTVAGDIARTFATVQTASELWRALGNQPMLTDSLNSYAHTWATIGNFDKALECADEALQIARSIGNTWAQSYSLIPHSVVNWQKMAVDAALAAMSDSIRLGEAIGFVGAQVVMRAIQARLRLAIGDTTKALEIARTGWELAAKSAPFVYSTAAGTLALVLVCVGQLVEADEVLATIPEDSSLDIFNYLMLETALCQRFLQRAEFEDAYALSTKVLDFLRLQGVRMYIPEFLHYQAQALIGLGQYDRASEALEEGIAVLQATGARWQLWEMAALLANLAQRRGDATSALAWQKLACTTIQAIATETSDVALRDTFLGQPKVVKLLHANRDG